MPLIRKNPDATQSPIFWDWVQRHRPWLLARFGLTPSPWALADHEWEAMQQAPGFQDAQDRPLFVEDHGIL